MSRSLGVIETVAVSQMDGKTAQSPNGSNTKWTASWMMNSQNAIAPQLTYTERFAVRVLCSNGIVSSVCYWMMFITLPWNSNNLSLEVFATIISLHHLGELCGWEVASIMLNDNLLSMRVLLITEAVGLSIAVILYYVFIDTHPSDSANYFCASAFFLQGAVSGAISVIANIFFVENIPMAHRSAATHRFSVCCAVGIVLASIVEFLITFGSSFKCNSDDPFCTNPNIVYLLLLCALQLITAFHFPQTANPGNDQPFFPDFLESRPPSFELDRRSKVAERFIQLSSFVHHVILSAVECCGIYVLLNFFEFSQIMICVTCACLAICVLVLLLMMVNGFRVQASHMLATSYVSTTAILLLTLRTYPSSVSVVTSCFLLYLSSVFLISIHPALMCMVRGSRPQRGALDKMRRISILGRTLTPFGCLILSSNKNFIWFFTLISVSTTTLLTIFYQSLRRRTYERVFRPDATRTIITTWYTTMPVLIIDQAMNTH